jgi:mannose-6-phosphate isomerase-like protein (cupin superfamily)
MSSNYVRAVDLDALSGDGFNYQMLWVGESCRWFASALGPKARGTGQHVHEVDHFYFVLRGELHVQLGAEQVVARPETVVYIPAGTPHQSWNESGEPELHIEVLAPGPDPSKVPWTETDSTDAPGGHVVRRVEDVDIDPKVEIFDRRLLVTKADGAEDIMLYEAELKPGDKGMGLHVHHTVDQFYYVLEGQLTCQIGLEQCTIGPNTLAVLPRDLPHDMWNDSAEVERHLSLVTPGAVPNQPGAHIGVELTAV